MGVPDSVKSVAVWPNYVAYAFVLLGSVIICQLYKLSLSDQAQASLSDLV
jgi:hypothetical protein